MESERVQCEAVVMREARPAFAAWLREPRRGRALRRRHAHAREADPQRARPLRCALGDGDRGGAPRACARGAADRRPAARPRRRHRGAVRRRRRAARRRPRPGLEALDPDAVSPPPGSRRTSCRAGGTPTRSSRRGRAPCSSRTAPATRPCSSTRSRRSGRCSGRCRCTGSASATSCSGWRSGTRPSRCPFGHRGANHPVRDLATGRVLVTVQNHGFAVLADGDVSHVSLNDGTCEGLAGDGFASVQFHPEAAPGPLDGLPFFEELAAACRSAPTFARS